MTDHHNQIALELKNMTDAYIEQRKKLEAAQIEAANANSVAQLLQDIVNATGWLFEHADTLEYSARSAGTGMLTIRIKETNYEITSRRQMLTREKREGESVYNNPRHFMPNVLLEEVAWLRKVTE